MDVNSDWELRLNVSDFDSEYVRSVFENHGQEKSPTIEFVLDSSPKDRHEATIHSISQSRGNIHREGNFLEVRARGFELASQQKKVGSNVHAYFQCGNRSTWFVWFRPLIEAARRRFGSEADGFTMKIYCSNRYHVARSLVLACGLLCLECRLTAQDTNSNQTEKGTVESRNKPNTSNPQDETKLRLASKYAHQSREVPYSRRLTQRPYQHKYPVF